MTAVQLCILAQMEDRTLSLLREGLGTGEGLTIEAAGRIALRQESIEIVPQLRRAVEKVEVLLQADPGAEPLKAPFRLDGRLVGWLAGDDTPDRKLHSTVSTVREKLPEAILTREEIDRTVTMLRAQDSFSLVHISGETGSGRKHFARHVAKKMNRELLLVPFDAVGEDGTLHPAIWRRVLRELLLSDRILCLYDVTCPSRYCDQRMPALLRQLERDLAYMGRPVFLTTQDAVKTVPFMMSPIHWVQIPTPTISQSVRSAPLPVSSGVCAAG